MSFYFSCIQLFLHMSLLLPTFILVKKSDNLIYKDPDWTDVLHKGKNKERY